MIILARWAFRDMRRPPHVYYISCESSFERRAQLHADLDAHGLRSRTHVPCVRAQDEGGRLSEAARQSLWQSAWCRRQVWKSGRLRPECTHDQPRCCLATDWYRPDGTPCSHWDAYDEEMRRTTSDRSNHHAARIPALMQRLYHHLAADVATGKITRHLQQSTAVCWNTIGASLAFADALRLIVRTHHPTGGTMQPGYVLILEDDARLQPGWQAEYRRLLRRHDPSR
eukprot:1265288-Prymnesium_polylepis.1